MSGKLDIGKIAGRGKSLCDVCSQAGIYNSSVPPVPKIQLKEISYLAAFPLPTSNFFLMATTELIWVPPTTPLLHNQRITPSKSIGSSVWRKSSRTHSAPLYNKAVYNHNDYSKTTITTADWQQGDDFAGRARGMIRRDPKKYKPCLICCGNHRP